MIQFLLLVNKLGQTRFANYQTQMTFNEKRVLESELVRKCIQRPDDACFVFIH
jgi:hypothetical protein